MTDTEDYPEAAPLEINMATQCLGLLLAHLDCEVGIHQLTRH